MRRNASVTAIGRAWVCLVFWFGWSSGGLHGADGKLEILSPTPDQVYQRTGYVPRESHEHQPGGPRLGSADVPVRIMLPVGGADAIEVQVQDLVPPTDGRLAQSGQEWQEVKGTITGKEFSGSFTVPAGGWYRLGFRARKGEAEVGAGSAERVGVGEVFLIAGQSYAEHANDERLAVQDPQGRVTLRELGSGSWRVAHDPEENPDRGTIWPPFGDHLVSILRVPVGFCNVASGGTASRQWLPGTPLYERLVTQGKGLQRFRAVLWQQGESDVIESLPREEYVKRLQLIRESAAKEWGFEPTWLLAKSTLHPTVYNEPVKEGAIRGAIDDLWKLPGFGRGPDTDQLAGENRGGPMTRRHFSGVGQRRAGLMWFVAAMNEIERQAELPVAESPFTKP